MYASISVLSESTCGSDRSLAVLKFYLFSKQLSLEKQKFKCPDFAISKCRNRKCDILGVGL